MRTRAAYQPGASLPGPATLALNAGSLEVASQRGAPSSLGTATGSSPMGWSVSSIGTGGAVSGTRTPAGSREEVDRHSNGPREPPAERGLQRGDAAAQFPHFRLQRLGPRAQRFELAIAHRHAFLQRLRAREHELEGRRVRL